MKPFNTQLSILILLTAVFISGCLPEHDADESTVIASVAGEQLTIGMAMQQIPEIALRQDTLQAIESFKNQWIQSKITEREARRLRLQNDTDFRKRLAQMENQLLDDMLTEYVLSEHKDELNVSRDEAQDYFQANRDRFVLDERHVRFRHITTNTRTEIDNARSDLMRGISWEQVLENYSVNPDLQLRESSQFWPISMAVADIPMLNRYLGVIGLSEISPIHRHRGQYHFVQLREVRNEGDHPDFDWLIPQIQKWLELERSQRITNSFKRNLYLQAESNNEIEQLSSSETQSALMDFITNTESN